MQSLEVISVNLLNILISLANLIILFFIIKKFLFRPVEKMLNERREELNQKYKMADDAIKRANEDEEYWKEQKKNVEIRAEGIIEDAKNTAKSRSERIVDDAKKRAEEIVKSAKQEAEDEHKKVFFDIKQHNFFDIF